MGERQDEELGGCLKLQDVRVCGWPLTNATSNSPKIRARQYCRTVHKHASSSSHQPRLALEDWTTNASQDDTPTSSHTRPKSVTVLKS